VVVCEKIDERKEKRETPLFFQMVFGVSGIIFGLKE